MRRTPTSRVAVVCLLTLVVGCGQQAARPGAGESGDAKGDAARGQQARASEEEKGRANDAEGGAPAEADDAIPPANSGLVRGLEGLLESAPIRESKLDLPTDLRSDLRKADDLLSRVKAENLAALREVNRRQRVRGEDSPNLILVVADRLVRGLVGCYGSGPSQTPSLDRLAAEGVRFTRYQSAAQGATPHWSLMTGLLADPAKAGQAAAIRPGQRTLAAVLWNAGYATALVGDCGLGGTVSPGEAARVGFEEWFGYRDSAEAADPWPEYLWSNAARLRVVANADGKRGRRGCELLRREVVDYLERHRRGRPFFLYVAWPWLDERQPAAGKSTMAGGAANDPTVPTDTVGRLDRALGVIVDQLKLKGLQRNTVLLVAGCGEASDGSEQSALAPLVVWAPGRFAGGRVVDQRCAACDLGLTLSELAGARWRPAARDGSSLLGVLKQ